LDNLAHGSKVAGMILCGEYAREVSLILGIQPEYATGNGGRYVQGVVIKDIQSFPYIFF
jgi:hypothetical protein